MVTNRKVAVVTGSYKGLGLAIACKLALRDDIWVIITSRQESNSKVTEQKLKAKGIEVDHRQLDVTDANSVVKFMEWVTSAYGRVDILINNAGVSNSNVLGEDSILTATPETMLYTLKGRECNSAFSCNSCLSLESHVFSDIEERKHGSRSNINILLKA